MDRLRDGLALRRQHLNLRSFATISSALCLFLGIIMSSIRLKSHTSGRTTSQGADHKDVNSSLDLRGRFSEAPRKVATTSLCAGAALETYR